MSKVKWYRGRAIDPELVLLVMIGLALLSSILFLAGRALVEMKSRTVEISVGLEDLIRLSRDRGLDLEEVIGKFAERGVRSLTIYEDTLESLSESGRVTIMSGAEIINLSRLRLVQDLPIAPKDFLQNEALDTEHAYIIVEKRKLFLKLEQALQFWLGGDRVKFAEGEGYHILDLRASVDEVLPLSVGFPDEVERIANELGLKTVLVFKNGLVYGYDTISLYSNLRGWRNISTLIFEGHIEKEFLSSLLSYLNTGRDAKLKIGVIESSGVVPELSGPFEENGKFYFVRAHIIDEKELANMAPGVAVARWVRAVRERNIRLLLVETMASALLDGSPMSNRSESFSDDLDYVSRITNILSRAGYKLGYDNTFAAFHPRGVWVFIISLGVLAGLLFLVRSEVGIGGWAFWWSLGLGVLFIAAVFYFEQLIFLRKSMAFAAALVFPILGLRLSGLNSEGGDGPWKNLVTFLRICLFSITGGLLIAGLFADVNFMLKVDANPFRGVKAALILPSLLIVLCFWKDKSKNGSLGGFLYKKLEVRHLLIGIALAIVAGLSIVLLLARSGNNSPVFLSEVELQVRLFLERVFVIRPRTKELITHPLMLLGIGLFARGERRLSFLLLATGMVGQASIINTFIHIHTPLWWSMIRSFYGIVWGMIGGTVLILLSQKNNHELLLSFIGVFSLRKKDKRVKAIPTLFPPS